MTQNHYINETLQSSLMGKIESLEKTIEELLQREESESNLEQLKEEMNVDWDKSLESIKTNVSQTQVLMETLQKQVHMMENKLNASIYNQNIESISDAGKTSQHIQVTLMGHLFCIML